MGKGEEPLMLKISPRSAFKKPSANEAGSEVKSPKEGVENSNQWLLIDY